MQVGDGCIAQFIEVMWKNLGGKSHGNTFYPLGQQQREFDRQCDRLSVSAVIGSLPFSRFRVEHHIQRKLGKPGFDVTGSSCTVARQDVTPVSLAVNE